MSHRGSSDRRDEALGALMRSALEEGAARGEPDFAAVYARAAAGPRAAARPFGPSRAPRAPAAEARRRLFLAFPAAAAAGLALFLGGSEALRVRAVRAELSLLALSVLSSDGVPGPSLPEAELSLFVEDLWNRGTPGLD